MKAAVRRRRRSSRTRWIPYILAVADVAFGAASGMVRTHSPNCSTPLQLTCWSPPGTVSCCHFSCCCCLPHPSAPQCPLTHSGPLQQNRRQPCTPPPPPFPRLPSFPATLIPQLGHFCRPCHHPATITNSTSPCMASACTASMSLAVSHSGSVIRTDQSLLCHGKLFTASHQAIRTTKAISFVVIAPFFFLLELDTGCPAD